MKEKKLIEENYTFMNINVQNGVLVCYGEFQPTPHSITYKYRITYDGNSRPKVKVTSPYIPFHDDIHIYPASNTLCLYHQTDLKWDSSRHHIHELIIPWTHEWFVFYELYQISGKWEHPFVPHKSPKKEL